jgi:hypothetical protein
MSMIGPVHTAWLFTRGSESVRIIRVGTATGGQYLLVNGPGSETAAHQTEDVMECVRQQSELERRLVGKGYRLERFTTADRRTGTDRRVAPRGSDRRSHLERVV